MTKVGALFICVIIILFVGVGYVSAAEKVFFYYTDPAGTPLAMTDQSGNVVWRTDNKPFGEVQSTTGSVENNKQFIGKEKDKETGLHNIGVRYMRDEIGRFISPDPVGPVNPLNNKTNYEMLLNPQSLNSYAYSLNNPYRYMDANGRWPTPVHNTIINKAFEGILSPAAISALKRGSKEADSLKYQGQPFSYMHAMSNALTKQSQEEATGLMNNYISQKVNEYKTLMSQRKTDAAYKALGMAMHPLMDATSPSHEGMQGWAGNTPIIDGTTIKAIEHGYLETEKVFNSNLEYSRRAVDSIKKLFDEANR